MSRYQVTVNAPGRKRLDVTLGWDPPLRHFFLQVLNPYAANENDELVYSSLSEPEGGFPTFDDLRRRLDEIEIDLPESVLAAVQADGR